MDSITTAVQVRFFKQSQGKSHSSSCTEMFFQPFSALHHVKSLSKAGVWGECPKVTRAGLVGHHSPLLHKNSAQGNQGLHFFHQLPSDNVMILRDCNTTVNFKNMITTYWCYFVVFWWGKGYLNSATGCFSVFFCRQP